jgi:DNA recombination protein RmuC
MKSIFQGAARDALKDNKEGFLEATETKLTPLNKALEDLKKKTGELETTRATDYGQLSKQIENMLSEAQRMQASSEKMQNLLKGSSQARGNWGEFYLEQIVGFAGMKEHVNFQVQKTLSDGSRPDMVILLPGGAGIPVDSKCPFTSYAEAKEATDPEKEKELLKAHAGAVKGHVKTLIGKNYSEFADGDIDFTVMFMPGDHLLTAALDVDPELQEYAFQHRILITSPVSLVALLRTVRVYWTHDEANRNAQEIRDQAIELAKRVEIWTTHYAAVGENFKKAVDAYNASKKSYDDRVRPQAKRLAKLKVVTQSKYKPLDDDKSGPQEIEAVLDLEPPKKD